MRPIEEFTSEWALTIKRKDDRMKAKYTMTVRGNRFKHGAWSYDGNEIAKRLYRKWSNMKNRCLNPNFIGYHRYGGRGIYVCSKWMDFCGFFEDMLPSYKEGMTLDRIHNDGPYSKENCRWATRHQQNRNKGVNRMLTLNGETKCLVDWAQHTGIGRACIDMRLRLGWSTSRALTQPPRLVNRPKIQL